MMKLILSLCVALSLSSPLAYSKVVDCPDLTESQTIVLKKTWKYGEDKMGQGYGAKLSAIAMQESNFGLYKKGHGAYGVFQMSPTTVAYMNGSKTTHGIRNKLLTNFQYSAQQAHKYIAYWADKGYSDKAIYQSYNGGYVKSPKSRKYAKSVQSKVKLLKQCYVYRGGDLHERS